MESWFQLSMVFLFLIFFLIENKWDFFLISLSHDIRGMLCCGCLGPVLAYSPAQESIAELQSKEEYESCNVSNPIRMYTDGLDVIPLDGEGIRYFVSSKYDNCKNGLKLHVNVLPQPHQSSEVAKVTTAKRSAMPFAVPPTTPSDSTRFRSSFILFFVRLGLFYMDL